MTNQPPIAAGFDDDDDIRHILEELSDEELEAVFALANDVVIHENFEDPLSKLKTDREEQMEFINSIYTVTIAMCGNRWGKTFAMCWLLVAIALCRKPDARHQPDPTRVLRVWFIAENYKTINDTILKDLTGFMKPGQYKLHKDGPQVTKMVITAENGCQTEVLFKPSTADPDTFESASPHYIFVDEGIKQDLFQRCLVRLGGNRGQYFQCVTRLPQNFRVCAYLMDLERGRGDFEEIYKAGYVKIIKGNTRQNKYITEEEHDLLEKSMAKDPIMLKARLKGEMDVPSGAVFNFRDVLYSEDGREFSYNRFSFNEFRDIYDSKKGQWYLLHDYGFADPAAWLLVWVDRSTGSVYFVDEIYAKGLSIQRAGELVYDMLQRWECYFSITMCIADKQIKADTRKKNEADSETSILSQYLTAKMPNGDPCFPPQMAWRCKEKDKRRPEYSLQLVKTMIEEENPATEGFPFYRYSPLMEMTCRENRMLMWRPPTAANKITYSEVTEGDDHSVACERYFTMARIHHDQWSTINLKEAQTNELGYLIGESRHSYFNF